MGNNPRYVYLLVDLESGKPICGFLDPDKAEIYRERFHGWKDSQGRKQYESSLIRILLNDCDIENNATPP